MGHRLPTFLRYRDLESHGLTRHGFDRMVSEGGYERIAPGAFVQPGVVDDTTAALMAIAAKNPRATLCLTSALVLHDLTDEIPSESVIAIPRGSQPLRVRFAPVSWHRFDPDTFDVGRTEHALGEGLSIGLYSPERTIIDLFRLRHVWGSDIAVSALKRWLQTPNRRIPELLLMAERFPKARPALLNAVEILL
ncbi:hypothetical protein D9V32_00685 [Mycetocola tolaasinivorans]|uniref:Transcriptional regulator n=2 Tax=Mycetocola tolaasinivorans TaxID=76635 RepID=A0A3L7AD26_9MICO|nr:hypothetical protein D9V32_00685 [Mycetocola tolaasinivorans]